MKDFIIALLDAFCENIPEEKDIDIEINALIDDYKIPCSVEDKREIICHAYELLDRVNGTE